MPYAAPMIGQDDPNKKNQDPTNISGGAGATFATGVPGQDAAGGGGAGDQKRSGNYANIQSYLDANKDQSEQMGTQVADKVVNTGNEARNSITNATQDFGNQVDQGSIKNYGTAKQESQDIVGQAKTKTYDKDLSSDQVNRFNEIGNAQYKGPTDLTNSNLYQPTQSKVQKAQDYAGMAGTDPGRYQLLSEVFARPDYSTGQKNLDNALISGNAVSKQKVADSSQTANDLGGLLTNAQTNTKALADQRKTMMDDIRSSAYNDINTGRNARTSEIDADLADKQSHWADRYNGLTSMLDGYSQNGGSLKLNPNDKNLLGLRDGQQLFNTLKGTPAASFLDLQNFDANKVVGRDEYSQLSALDKLAGQVGLSNSSKFNDPSLAGTSSLDNNLSGQRFGQAALDNQNKFNDYAAGANFSADGRNSQSYNYGVGGSQNGEATRSAHIDANLKDILANAGYTTHGTAPNDVSSSFFGAQGEMTNDWLHNNLGSLTGPNSDLWRDGSSEAERAAQQWANQQAQDSMYSQINAALADQGFNNHVQVTDPTVAWNNGAPVGKGIGSNVKIK